MAKNFPLFFLIQDVRSICSISCCTYPKMKYLLKTYYRYEMVTFYLMVFCYLENGVYLYLIAFCATKCFFQVLV